MLRAILTTPSRHQTDHFRSRLIYLDPRLETADYGQEVRAATPGICRVKLEGQEDLHLIVAAGRKCKVRRHHTHDGRRLGVDLNLLADDLMCSAECALPQSMRYQSDIWSTVAILFGREVAAELRLHT